MISQKLSIEDLSPEIILYPDAVLEDIVTVSEEQTTQDTCPYVVEDCQSICMTTIDTDNTVEEHILNNDTDILLMSPGKIFMEAFTEQNIEIGEFEISDPLRFFSDSESLKMLNSLSDKLECQGHAFPVDPSEDESSDALPELVTALNAFSGTVVQPVTPVVPIGRQLNTKEEQLNSELSILQLNDDSTQKPNMIEPQLATVQEEDVKALTGCTLQKITNEQVYTQFNEYLKNYVYHKIFCRIAKLVEM